MKNIKKFLGAGLISAMLVTLASFSAVTVAKYVESKKVGQTATKQEKTISIFLNANIWNIDNAVFYMWVNSKVIAPTTHVTPTVSGKVMDLYVFEYKSSWTSLSFVFIRANPDVPITNLESWPSEVNQVWNQTNDIPYNSDRNYYCIKTWSGSNYGNSKYTYNRINKNGNSYSWGDPDGHDTLIGN